MPTVVVHLTLHETVGENSSILLHSNKNSIEFYIMDVTTVRVRHMKTPLSKCQYLFLNS